MKLSLIGHASVLIEAGPVRMVSDPWLVGRAFNDGWAIHPQPAWQPDDLADATHLWISHEHPDHLSIPTLRAIPAEVRARLTVLFQRTWSGTVADYLATLGFADVIELEHRRLVTLAPDVEVFCWQVGHQDSALAIRHGGRTVLNLNDCKPSPAGLRRLRRATGPIDVLLDQFSIAGWAGNPGEHARLDAAKQDALETLLAHVRTLTPAATVPFASFMRFCHQENVHLNRAAVSLRDVAQRWEAHGSGALVLLHHGDRWAITDPAPSTATALAVDEAVAAEPPGEPVAAAASKSLEDVESALAQRMHQWRTDFTPPLLRRLVEPIRLVIDDLDTAMVVDPLERTAPVRSTVRLTSQPAWFAGKQRFGVETLLISGRFRLEGDEGGWGRFAMFEPAGCEQHVDSGIAGTVDVVGREVARVSEQHARPRHQVGPQQGDHGGQVRRVSGLVGQLRRDDDLGVFIDDGLDVEALVERPVGHLHDPRLRIGEVALRLRSRRG